MRSRKLLALIFSLLAIAPALAGYMTLLGAGVGSIQPVVSWIAGTDAFPSTLSFSRTSLATMFDSTGKLTYGPNNLLPQSNTFSNAAWTDDGGISVTSGVSDPDGGTAAWTLTGVSGTNQADKFQTYFNSIQKTFTWTICVKAGTATWASIGTFDGATDVKQYFNLSNGTLGSSQNGTPLGATITPLTNGWYQLSVTRSIAGAASSARFQITQATADLTPALGNQGLTLYIYKAVLSAVTYETTPRTADQVITTSAAYYGPRIDYDPNTLAVKGLLIEENRTWVALWNRDFTNAAWTKTSVTAALDQVGIDGVANSASSLTASANNGTVLQAITLASSQRATSAYVKRLVGSGAVSMTTDGGTTWTDITSQLGAGAYARATIPEQTVTNPSVGFKFATSGDKIAVDFFGNENGAFQTSPLVVASASVTRAADVAQFTGTALTALQGSAGAVIVQSKGFGLSGSRARIISTTSDSPLNVVLIGTSVTVDTYNAAIQILNSGSSVDPTLTARYGVTWSASGRSIAANGGVVGTDANQMHGGLTTQAWLGSQVGSSAWASGWYQSFAIYNQRLPDATLQSKSVVGAAY